MAMPDVNTVVETGDQFQIVIGHYFGGVFDEFMKLVQIEGTKVEDGNKRVVLNRIITMMSVVFAPFIYILAAVRIPQGVLIITTLLFDGFADTGTYEAYSFISWAPFTHRSRSCQFSLLSLHRSQGK